jgi:hypothetical protein
LSAPFGRRAEDSYMSTIEKTPVQVHGARVFEWRFTELLRAGYSSDQAWRLASDSGVDIRFAERLLVDGCPPETAQRILL